MIKKKKFMVTLTVRDTSIISDVAILYCCGPRFHVIKQSMSNDDKQSLCAFAMKLKKFQKIVQKNNPHFFINYNKENWNVSEYWNVLGELECSERNIKTSICAFEESFKEYASDDEEKNYYEIRLHTSMTNKEILLTYYKLKNFYLTLQQDRNENNPID
jgi:hypothetical protein